MFALAILALVVACHSVSAFNTYAPQVTRTSLSQLSMGGGRSPAEKGVSKGNMFKNMRNKFNTAAEIPGFFDVAGRVLPDIELFCKSNKDGSQIGDCPFTQFIQLVLLKKGVPYKVTPTLPADKPEWLISKHEGKMPAIMVKGTTMTDSLAIAEYIEKSYPHTSLTRQGAYSYQEVLEKTAGFFPALSAFLKNKDVAQDEALGGAVEAQLDLLDEVIRSSPGQYVCGLEMTLADLYLAPQLYHAVVAMPHFKQTEVLHLDLPTRPALEGYMVRLFDMEEFCDKRAHYSADQVLHGWRVQRGEA
mmetsp:Transcript_16129/g.35735  ORF Transcript_16129/g.35735 Transcript_16129/m.35735 type:complete len:303 (-) Transcript_16129:53-961(-)